MSKRKAQRSADTLLPASDSLFPERTGRMPQLGDGEREVLDAYWTPLWASVLCCKFTKRVVEEHVAKGDVDPDVVRAVPRSMLENAVGGGSWVVAARRVWRDPAPTITRCDIDPTAPGLFVDRRPGDRAHVGDFMSSEFRFRRHEWDLNLGNYPYGEDFIAWMERMRSTAPVMGQLLRSTILGSLERRRWFEFEHPPAYVVTLSPRCLWEGPGARKESDTMDPHFVLWIDGITDTRHRWLGRDD